MARKPMVTRTIKTTTANVLCMDIVNSEPFNQSVTLPRTYPDDAKLMRAVEDIVNNDTVKAVHVVDVEVNEKLYGMTEQKFVELAEILPDRCVKSTDDAVSTGN